MLASVIVPPCGILYSVTKESTVANAMQSAPLASMRAVQRFLSFETAKTMTPTSSSGR